MPIKLGWVRFFRDDYIDSRYPGDMGLLPYGKPTLEDAKEFHEFALNPNFSLDNDKIL